MKTFAIAAIVATVASQATTAPGDYCDNDSATCQATNTTCVSWKDSDGYPRKSCEDCLEDNRILTDEYGVESTFFCPGEEEKASSLVAGAAALFAAVSMMAWALEWD